MIAVPEVTRRAKAAQLVKVSRAVAVGSPLVLPNGFTGWSLDAGNGLSLYLNGVLQARYGSAGGAGVLPAYSGYQPVDATHNCTLRFELPASIVNVINGSRLSFSLKPFRATQQTASGAGSLHSHTISTAHQHRWAAWDGTVTADVTSFKTRSVYAAGYGYVSAFMDTNAIMDGKDLLTDNAGGVAGTSGNEGSHTHALNAPSGLYDTGMAQGCHVFIDGVDRTSALSGPWGVGSALDVSDLDISAWITMTGWHEVLITSTSLGVIIAQVMTKAQLKTV